MRMFMMSRTIQYKSYYSIQKNYYFSHMYMYTCNYLQCGVVHLIILYCERMRHSLLYKSVNNLAAVEIPNFTSIHTAKIMMIHHQQTCNFANIKQMSAYSYMNSFFFL